KLKNLLEQRTAYSRNFEIDSSEVDFYYYKANVVSNSILKQNNFISVDIGQKHGIEKGMGVMGNDGIVGIVYNCSKNYSSIIPLINTDLQVSVKISSNNFMGSLSWSGADYRFANMSEVPLHVDIEIGDSIVTSGFSAIFPPNMPVGTIESYNEIKSLGFYEIKIKLFTDFAELRYVYIVDNKHKAEITELENENVK
ncbi:MAG: rod shape-determining protein MreC, partial [Bacteroidales bacterium]|nr:rod shape-determining protein MreC [Bacteroidales bacterium]